MGSEVKRYTMPAMNQERASLIEELCVMTTESLGYPTRQANIECWMQMPIVRLRMCHALWVKTWQIIKENRAREVDQVESTPAESALLFS
jgi:hypothetical protein